MSRHAAVTRPDLEAVDVLAAGRAAPDPAAVAQYSATLLPGVLWVLGAYLFDGGAVPGPLQGTVGLLVTGACTVLVGWSRRR